MNKEYTFWVNATVDKDSADCTPGQMLAVLQCGAYKVSIETTEKGAELFLIAPRHPGIQKNSETVNAKGLDDAGLFRLAYDFLKEREKEVKEDTEQRIEMQYNSDEREEKYHG